VVAQNSNTPCYGADFYPYGGERVYSNGCAETFKFTGMMRDVTGDDHTQYRQYMSNLGRWASPDPLAGDVSNPQSLNRYAYVMNNPTTLTDPSGMGPKDGWDPCDRRPDKASCGGGQVGPNDPGPYATDPADIECAYVGTANAGCSQLPGLWSNGTPVQPGVTVSVGGTGSTTGSAQIWSTNDLPCELGDCGSSGWPGGATGPLSGDFGPFGLPASGGFGMPCDFGTCGNSFPGDGFQAAAAAAAGYGIWEFAKDAIFAGLAYYGLRNETRKLYRAHCKCSVIDLSSGIDAGIGVFVEGDGVGSTPQQAKNAARIDASMKAARQYGTIDRPVRIKHCNYTVSK
jgi:RHS repeat-associated protein